MKQTGPKGISAEFRNHLLDYDNRAAIETALAIDSMLRNPGQDYRTAYTLGMGVWEQMRIDRPVIEPVCGSVTSPYAAVNFFTPEGTTFKMRIEMHKGKPRLRSMLGKARQLKDLMAECQKPQPKEFLAMLSKKHREGRIQAATIRR
ncbi:MAG: hypothetical protein V4682_02010 [Patescibacteria group bacterium]